MFGKRTSSLLSVFLFATAGAPAQVIVGSVSGTITDSSGAAVPDVAITISGPRLLGGSRKVASDSLGAYKFLSLPPGVYQLRYEKAGFKTAIRDNVEITTNFDAQVNVTMEVGQVSESVTVEAGAIQIDAQSVTNQTVTGQNVIEKIPNPRDPWVLARMVPAVTPGRFDVGGTEGMQQYSLTVHGSRDSDKKFAIDGVEVNWPGGTGGATAIYYDAGSFQEVNYQVGAQSAEISQGGVYMSMVTKDGSNQLRGSVMFTGANDALQGQNVDSNLRNQLLATVPASIRNDPKTRAGNPIDHIYDFNANVGGPLIKDKLWWFGSFRRWSVNNLVNAFNPDGSQAIDDNYIWNLMGKVSYQLNTKNRFSVYYNRNQKFRGHRRDTPPFFIEDKASTVQNQPGHNVNGKYTFTPSPRWVVDTGFAFTRIEFPLRYQADVKPTDISITDSVLQSRINAATSDYVNPNSRTSWDTSASYFFRGAGSHTLKFGTQFMWSRFTQKYKVNGDNTYTFNNGVPAFVVVYNTPLEQKTGLNQFAFFVQDTWQVRRGFTLNLGMRFEKVRGFIPAQESPAGTYVPARRIERIDDVPNFKNVVPRLGLAWDVTGKGRTVIKASASMYLQNIGVQLPITFHPFIFRSLNRTWNDANGDRIPQPAELGPLPQFAITNAVIDPNLERPYNWEYSLGWQQQLPAGILLSITGWYRDSRDNMGRQNELNPRSAYTATTVNNPLTGQPLTVYSLSAALRNQERFLVTNFKDLDSTYQGVDINFAKRFSAKWQMFGGMTFGRDYGAFRGDLVYGFDDFNNPNFDINRRGRLGTDTPFQFKVAGSYQLPGKIDFAGNYQFFVGYPVRYQMVTPGLIAGNQTIDLTPRGRKRLPDISMFDMRLSRSFKFGDRWNLQPQLDIFNLGNINTTTAQLETLAPGNLGTTSLGTWGRPTVIVAPRLFKLGVRLDF
jgi:hypothetical protein